MEEGPPVLGKLHIPKRKAKSKMVSRMDFQEAEHGSLRMSSHEKPGLDELDNSFAFNPSKFLNKPRSSAAGKAISTFQGTVETIRNPKKSFKKRAATKLAKTARPYISRKADLDFLEAHDVLAQAKAHINGEDGECPVEARNIDRCQSRIDDLQEKRDTMRIAWMTGRHVRRVKAVDSTPRSFPQDEHFEKEDDCGATEYLWGKWLGYNLLYYSRPFTAQYIDDFEELPYRTDVLRRHIERLITVSAPVQTLISRIRCIYRWDDPRRTAAWMILYFVLWYMSHLMTFAYGYLVYAVLKNYYYPTTLESMRESSKRSLDRGVTALKIGEIIDREGNDKWLDPMIESLGPYIQVQIADLANILEILYNFYHWKRPAKTRVTLVLFSTLSLICLLTDTDFCLRGIYFLWGLTFFFFWPISSRYPRYRLLVSPLRWAFWDIPTHATWSFQYLQEHANKIKREIQANNAKLTAASAESDDSSASESSATHGSIETSTIASFPCTHSHTPGHLILSLTDFKFEASFFRSSSDPVHFQYKYSDLDEMRKRESHSKLLSHLAKFSNELDSLELKVRTQDRKIASMRGWGDEPVLKTFILDNMIGRDKAFNSMIGFSGTQWQDFEG